MNFSRILLVLVSAVPLCGFLSCKTRSAETADDNSLIQATSTASPLGRSLKVHFTFINGTELGSISLESPLAMTRAVCEGSSGTAVGGATNDTTKCTTADRKEIHVTRRRTGDLAVLNFLIWNAPRAEATKQWAYHCERGAPNAADLLCDERSAAPRKMLGKLASSISPTAPLSAPETVPFPNLHRVGPMLPGGVQVMRGMAPLTKEMVAELRGFDIKHVVYFKLATDNDEEFKQEARWFNPDPVEPLVTLKQVPFRWKSFPNFAEPCRQTVEALRSIKEALAQGHSTFFHCTVGEDRTGYLAGVYRMLVENGDPRRLFKEEMCERGYSAGNPLKPYAAVVAAVDADLTPIFARMIYKFRHGQLSWENLDPETCAEDPSSQPDFATNPEYDPSSYRCLSSTHFDP